MVSMEHESLLSLFDNDPKFVAELLEGALSFSVPKYAQARMCSADFTEVQPTEYRADRVIVLLDEKPVLGIIVEVQRSVDERKRFTWPVYLTTLRARLKCPVCLLVVASDDSVARWAAKPIDLGDDNHLWLRVLSLQSVPEVVDEARARAQPELAVLSAIAHGRDADVSKAARIAQMAGMISRELDPERSRFYFDLVMTSLSDAAREVLQTMNRFNYEYRSDFAKHYMAEGRAEGRAISLRVILHALSERFGMLDDLAKNTLANASLQELDKIAERMYKAATLNEALGAH